MQAEEGGVCGFTYDLRMVRASCKVSPLRLAVLLAAALLIGAPIPAAAQTGADTKHYAASNGEAGAAWTVRSGALADFAWVDASHHRTYPQNSPFTVVLADGSVLHASDFRVERGPEQVASATDPNSPRAAARLPGHRWQTALVTRDGRLRANWSVVLLDGTSYVREELTLTAAVTNLPVSQVRLIDLPLPGGTVSGTVAGSPIVITDAYFGFEHPISQSRVFGGRATAWIERDLPLRASSPITYSAVFGTVHPGQLRRDFLAYLETERAHPYRTFLHYNSWYDLGLFTPYTEADAVDRIHTFGEELTRKRGVTLDSFLFDDGWDNHGSLWGFNSGFPRGFAPLDAAAKEVHADGIGVWMSPWGGYSKPKAERVAFGRGAGYEIVKDGYALSGPRYYAAFRDVALGFEQQFHVNQFKLDGTGNVNSVVPGSSFDSDFAAMLHLIGDLRAASPEVFINLTTGTWPSPFWTRSADSIWRGGEDDDFAGVGTYRERWITYRDSDTYRRVVQNGPLYPLNSLMLHGIIYAQFHKHLNADPGDDFRNEVRSYFGSGTQLQEMYITPKLLTAQNWDDLAEAAKWSRENAAALRDTHWVGGDPLLLEVYGWAGWTPEKAVITLRNPSNRPATYSLQLHDLLEIPAGVLGTFQARSPWKDDASKATMMLSADSPQMITLQPFEVLTLNLLPR